MAEHPDAFMTAAKRALFGAPDQPRETAEARAARLGATWPRTMALLGDVLSPDGRIQGGARTREGVWLTAIERLLARVEVLEQRERDRG